MAALVQHATPDPDVLGALAPLAGADGVASGAAVLRAMNEPGGLAHELAPAIAEQAVAAAATADRAALAGRFRASADVIEAGSLRPDDVVAYGPGAVSVAAVTEIAVMEAVVHGLDLVAAVGGAPPPADAVALARDVLARVPDPVAFVEAAAGRAPVAAVLPAIR